VIREDGLDKWRTRVNQEIQENKGELGEQVELEESGATGEPGESSEPGEPNVAGESGEP